jgi:hypothetical protein
MPKDAPDQAAKASPPDPLFKPQIRLDGEVNDDMFRAFRDAFAEAREGADPVVVELTTFGGDADVGRRIATDVRLFRERTGRRPLFFGKTQVYSAGATIMAAFLRDDRWLSRDCVLMVHCRKLNKTLDLSRALRSERPMVEALLAEIDTGMKVEREGFLELIEGSDVGEDELYAKATTNWYIDAEDCLKRGLIAGVV